MNRIREVLDLARWAPSGDNTQPWRFEILSDDQVLIHGHDTRDRCVYDLDGWASQLSHGALLETLSLAATRFHRRAHVDIVSDDGAGRVTYSVTLEHDNSIIVEDLLVASIRDRTVQRRRMRPTSLSPDQRKWLEQSVDGFRLMWFSSWGERLTMAALNADNARIRLTIPEAFEVHKAVIEWGCTTSEDRLPDAALGGGRILLAIMRNAMSSWKRVDFLNRYAAGTVLPRLALDFLPGVACAAHFALIEPAQPGSTAQRIAAGRAVQRMWLSATRLGLQMQPSYTPLVFARYAREGRAFTRSSRARRAAGDVARRLDEILGAENARNAVFLGRLGPSRPVGGRSLRLPLDRLIMRDDSATSGTGETGVAG